MVPIVKLVLRKCSQATQSIGGSSILNVAFYWINWMAKQGSEKILICCYNSGGVSLRRVESPRAGVNLEEGPRTACKEANERGSKPPAGQRVRGLVHF